MKFARAHYDVAGREARLPMTPMIDVVFMLLIYFLLSTTLADPESDLATALRAEQQPGVSSASDFQPQVVEVFMRGDRSLFRVGQRELRTTEELEVLLTGLPKDPGVFVEVSGEVPMRVAAGALQAAKDAGFVRVSYVPRGTAEDGGRDDS